MLHPLKSLALLFSNEFSTGPSKPWMRLAALGAIAAVFLLHAEHFGMIVDDTFITLRYATNWAQGLGPVFNPGERVEGYSNFLWMALLSGLIQVGINGLVAARYAGILFALPALFLAVWFDRLVAGRFGWGNIVAALLLASSGTFALWAGAGLENGLFTFLVLLGQVIFLQGWSVAGALRGLIWGLIFGVAALCRPDGVLFFATALCLRATLKRVAPWRKICCELATAATAFVLTQVPLFLWRHNYYGEWLPNTFYLKGTYGWPELYWGITYLWGFLAAGWFLPAIPVILLPILRKLRYEETALSIFTAVYALYVAAIGGDRVFPYFRFLVVVLPGFFILAARGLEEIRRVLIPRIGVRPALAAALLIPAAAAAVSIRASTRGEHWETVQDNIHIREDGEVIGSWLAGNVRPGTWLAMSRVGVIPYYSGLPTIDLLGKTDRHIARLPGIGQEHLPGHRKHDFGYALARRPDIIFYLDRLYPKPTRLRYVNPALVGFQELADPAVRRRFDEEYQPVIYPAGEKYLTFFLRRNAATWLPSVLRKTQPRLPVPDR